MLGLHLVFPFPLPFPPPFCVSVSRWSTLQQSSPHLQSFSNLPGVFDTGSSLQSSPVHCQPSYVCISGTSAADLPHLLLSVPTAVQPQAASSSACSAPLPVPCPCYLWYQPVSTTCPCGPTAVLPPSMQKTQVQNPLCTTSIILSVEQINPFWTELCGCLHYWVHLSFFNSTPNGLKRAPSDFLEGGFCPLHFVILDYYGILFIYIGNVFFPITPKRYVLETRKWVVSDLIWGHSTRLSCPHRSTTFRSRGTTNLKIKTPISRQQKVLETRGWSRWKAGTWRWKGSFSFQDNQPFPWFFLWFFQNILNQGFKGGNHPLNPNYVLCVQPSHFHIISFNIYVFFTILHKHNNKYINS